MNISRSVLCALAGLALLVGSGADEVRAEEIVQGDDDAVVRILNNHQTAVRVFVFDTENRRFELGRVDRSDYQELTIPEALLAEGSIQIKVYPVGGIAGLGTKTEAGHGVKSQRIQMDAGDAVDFWLEPDLADSQVKVIRG